MLNGSASLTMSTSVLKALPGKFGIKRNSPSILYLFTQDELRKLVKDEHARIDKETAATGQKAQAKATPAKTSKTSPVKPARNLTTKASPALVSSKKVTPGKPNSKTDKKDKSSL